MPEEEKTAKVVQKKKQSGYKEVCVCKQNCG